jgi:hypothetical protein
MYNTIGRQNIHHYTEMLTNQAAVAWLRWHICRNIIECCYDDAYVCVGIE